MAGDEKVEEDPEEDVLAAVVMAANADENSILNRCVSVTSPMMKTAKY